MFFKNISKFATAKGTLNLVKGETSISGKLNMTIINSANNTRYPANLEIMTDYHSVRNFYIPPAAFDAATFNLLNEAEFLNTRHWWFKCRQISNEMQMELWGKVGDQWLLVLATNPETTSSQEWYVTTSEVGQIC